MPKGPKAAPQNHLKDTGAILSAALSSMTDAVFISDEQGEFVYFNEAFAAFHKFKNKDEALKALNEYPKVLEVYMADGTPAPLEMWAVPRALRGEAGTAVEYRLRRKDTGESWVGSYNFSPIRNNEGQIIGSVVVGRDITEEERNRKQIIERTEELAAGEARLKRAQAIARVGDWELDLSSGEVSWSDQTYQIFGFDSRSYKPSLNKLFNLIAEQSREELREKVEIARNEGRGFEMTFQFTRPDGSQRFNHATATVHRDANGVPIRLVGTAQDVTQAEILKIEILNAKRSAESANQAKDHFLANLSHELRTPLTAILTWSQILERKSLPIETIQKGLRTIRESALAQNQLISDLLDVSRIASGKIILETQTVRLREHLLLAIESIRPIAERKSIEIVEELADENLVVSADPVRLKQVYWNVLSNALKFTPSGGKITVALSSSRSPVGAQAQVTVRDTGKGIPPNFIPNLFDRFSQADSSSIRVHGGLGLGLSIASTLMELHGGTITANSPGEGLGATFTMTLPLAPRSSENSLLSLAPITGTGASTYPLAQLAPCKVLLVDDDDRTREALRIALSSLGAEVKESSSAEDALAAMSEFRPDVIVSDLSMPREDGFSLIRKIRARKPEDGGNTPAIALSAYADSRTAQLAQSAGFQVHLPKPFDAVKLAGEIFKLKSTT